MRKKIGRKWKRVRLQDLADPEEQNRILGLLAQAGQSGADSPEKRPPESPQVERIKDLEAQQG